MTVFSFHPVKTVATGEGGAVTTNDPGLYEKMKRLRSHGTTQLPADFRNAGLAFGAGGEANPWYYESHELGFNYRASDIHCALALSQLGKLGRFASKRRDLAEIYDRKLAALAPVILPPKRVPGCDPAWHLYAARFDFQRMGMPRETLMRRLMAAGIGTQVHYMPVPWQPYYSRRDATQNPGGQFPGAAAYYRQTLSLPLFPAMEEADVARVVAALAACVAAG
jgi:dTDP-4-amino-4,6-dideoxygalactose transaminase